MLKTTMSRGYAISYNDSGRGPAVMLVPGYLQSAAEFEAAGYIDRLASHWRVLSVDPLGSGRSDRPHDPTPYHAPDVASDLIAVLDAEGIDRAVLWGYSRGAWLVVVATLEVPDRVSGVVIGGAALTFPRPTGIPAWVDPLNRGDWDGFWKIFPVHLDAETRGRFERTNDPAALAAERVGRFDPWYPLDLNRISASALVYCGREDEPQGAMPTADALHTELHIVEGCDHLQTFVAVDRVMNFAIPFLTQQAENGADSVPGTA